MRVFDTEVYGVDRCCHSAGLPKGLKNSMTIPTSINKLGQSVPSSGHDCFLKGITVHSKIEANHSFWIQWMRYHFHDIISSTSKMHTILKIDPVFEIGTDDVIINRWYELRASCIESGDKNDFNNLIMSTPMGMLLTADTVTNYLQLKTIYNQRVTHKMSAWGIYCDWIRTLPKFVELTQKT